MFSVPPIGTFPIVGSRRFEFNPEGSSHREKLRPNRKGCPRSIRSCGPAPDFVAGGNFLHTLLTTGRWRSGRTNGGSTGGGTVLGGVPEFACAARETGRSGTAGRDVKFRRFVWRGARPQEKFRVIGAHNPEKGRSKAVQPLRCATRPCASEGICFCGK